MTEDRETANPGPSSSEDSPKDPTPGPSKGRSSLDDDPHPFDRLSEGAQFQGPLTGRSPEETQSKGRPEAPWAGGSRSRGSGSSGFEPSGFEETEFDDAGFSDGNFGGSGFGPGSISSLQDIIDLARMGGGLPAEMAKSWIRENQTTAMIGAFAVGVFIGAISRD